MTTKELLIKYGMSENEVKRAIESGSMAWPISEREEYIACECMCGISSQQALEQWSLMPEIDGYKLELAL